MLFLEFHLDGHRYALPAADIAAILPSVPLRPLPAAPTGVAGLLDHRGAPVPVIDLSALALGQPAPPALHTRIILVHYPPRLLGLILPHALRTLRIPPESFHPTGLTPPEARYLGPVARDPDGLIQRIHPPHLLTPELRHLLFPD